MVRNPRTDIDAPPVLGPFEYRFAPSLGAIRLTRHALANWLGGQPGIDADAVDDLLLACSELTTNAVSHASGADGSVALRARIVGDDVVLEMEDDGAGFAWPVRHVMADVLADDEHGRGLFIVEALTDEMVVETDGGRTVVRCTKRGILRRDASSSAPRLSARFQSDGSRDHASA